MNPRTIALHCSLSLDEGMSVLAAVRETLDHLHAHRTTAPKHQQPTIEVEIRRLERGFKSLHHGIAAAFAGENQQEK